MSDGSAALSQVNGRQVSAQRGGDDRVGRAATQRLMHFNPLKKLSSLHRIESHGMAWHRVTTGSIVLQRIFALLRYELAADLPVDALLCVVCCMTCDTEGSD